MKDKDLMEQALNCFEYDARQKFLQGVKEHNPNGDKGLERMTLKQKIKACQEEVIDLWFYLASIEEEECIKFSKLGKDIQDLVDE